MKFLFTAILVFLLIFSIYSVTMAFYKKSKYKLWMNSINSVGQIKSVKETDKKQLEISLLVRFNGKDIPLSLLMDKKKFKAPNLGVESLLPLIYNEETGEIRNGEYLKDEYKKHFYHSWVFFLFFCILLLFFIDFIAEPLSEREFFSFSNFYRKNTP